MTILYGTPEDPEAFRRYYLDTHVPIAREMRGLTGWNLQWIDQSAEPGPYLLVAELFAPSRQAMDAVMSSPAAARARADLDNFVTGGVEFLSGEIEEVALA